MRPSEKNSEFSLTIECGSRKVGSDISNWRLGSSGVQFSVEPLEQRSKETGILERVWSTTIKLGHRTVHCISEEASILRYVCSVILQF